MRPLGIIETEHWSGSWKIKSEFWPWENEFIFVGLGVLTCKPRGPICWYPIKKNSLKIVPIQYVRQRCLGSAPVTKSGSLTQQKTQLFLIGQFQDRDILWLLLYSSAGVSSPLGSRRNRAQPLGGPSESKQLQSAGVSSVMVTAPSVPVRTFDNSCYFNHL